MRGRIESIRPYQNIKHGQRLNSAYRASAAATFNGEAGSLPGY